MPIAAVHDPASVVIMVGDSGVGIDSQNLDRIFDAFFATKSDGMGMGSSICRSIIEGYGGRHLGNARGFLKVIACRCRSQNSNFILE